MRRKNGFTMVELIVSLALGLIVSLAATQLFVANQVSFNFQRGTADVQAGGRFATDMLVRDLRLSGLPAGADVNVPGLIISMPELTGLSALASPLTPATYVTLNGSVTAGISASDQLLLQYVANTDTEDCEGNTVLKDSYVLARYFIRTDTATSSQALACDGGHRLGAVISGLGDNGQVLVAGVDSFQVLLGIDDGQAGAAAGVARAIRYVNVDTYNGLAVKPPVVAVRIGLLVRSQERVGDTVAPSRNIQVLDVAIPSSAAALMDGRMRRLFVSTIALRNLDPEKI